MRRLNHRRRIFGRFMPSGYHAWVELARADFRGSVGQKRNHAVPLPPGCRMKSLALRPLVEKPWRTIVSAAPVDHDAPDRSHLMKRKKPSVRCAILLAPWVMAPLDREVYVGGSLTLIVRRDRPDAAGRWW